MAMTAEEKREYQRAYRAANREKLRAYDRARNSSEYRKAKAREYHSAHREELGEYNRQWRVDHPDYIKQKNAENYKKNGEAIRAQARAWAKENRERHNERTREWAAAHPGVGIARTRRYQGLRMDAGPSFTRFDWQRYLDLFGERCLACGSNAKLTADHVVPLSQGGPNTIDNIQGLCQPCNSSKGAKTHDFRMVA